MLELSEIAAAIRRVKYPSLPLEIDPNAVLNGHDLGPKHIRECTPQGWGAIAAQYFRLLVKMHTFEQREAANIFIKAMHDAHPDTEAIRHILRSERIKSHAAITAKQALRAYQKFQLLEQTSYQLVDDGKGVNHKELRFMHGLVLKLKTFFR